MNNRFNTSYSLCKNNKINYMMTSFRHALAYNTNLNIICYNLIVVNIWRYLL